MARPSIRSKKNNPSIHPSIQRANEMGAPTLCYVGTRYVPGTFITYQVPSTRYTVDSCSFHAEFKPQELRWWSSTTWRRLVPVLNSIIHVRTTREKNEKAIRVFGILIDTFRSSISHNKESKCCGIIIFYQHWTSTFTTWYHLLSDQTINHHRFHEVDNTNSQNPYNIPSHRSHSQLYNRIYTNRVVIQSQ